MGNWRLLMGVLAGLATASALLFGRAPHHPQRAAAVALETRAATDRGAVGQLLAGFSTGDTGAYVRRLERRVRLQPRDGQTLTLLGLAYQQRARETGDPSSYWLSARALGVPGKPAAPARSSCRRWLRSRTRGTASAKASGSRVGRLAPTATTPPPTGRWATPC